LLPIEINIQYNNAFNDIHAKGYYTSFPTVGNPFFQKLLFVTNQQYTDFALGLPAYRPANTQE